MTPINNQNLYLQQEHNRCQTAMTEKVTVGLSAQLQLSQRDSILLSLLFMVLYPTACMLNQPQMTPVGGCRYVVGIVLQLVTFYFTQTSSANRALQDYVAKPINGPPSCQGDSWEPIINVVTHASCQTWLTDNLQESHSEQRLNPPAILVVILKDGGWNSSHKLFFMRCIQQLLTSHRSQKIPENLSTILWPWLHCSR